MKKLMLMLVAILAMTACKKEDQGVTPQNVVGKWNVTQRWNETENTWKDVSSQKLYAQFNADGSYKASGGSGTYTIEGQTVICKVGSMTVKYEMVLDGNKATATVTEGSAKPYKVQATRE